MANFYLEGCNEVKRACVSSIFGEMRQVSGEVRQILWELAKLCGSETQPTGCASMRNNRYMAGRSGYIILSIYVCPDGLGQIISVLFLLSYPQNFM